MGVFSYYDPNTEATVYHVIPSPGSEHAPSTLYSETESTQSASTIQSDDLPGYFVLHHGRQQPANENVVKWYPSDNLRRYVVRHLLVKTVFGGWHADPVKVKEVLSPVKGRTRQALELGTRIGTWIQVIAADFPHVQFRTVDAVPIMPHIPRHNITFEVYDFTEGLILEDESQDVVFLNIILEVVKDYRTVVREAHRVLRPGGMIFVLDRNPGIWDSEDIAIQARQNPQGCRFFGIIRQRISHFGIDPDTCDKLPQWLAPESELWNKGQGGFKDIQSDIRTVPFFPHDGHSCMERIDTRIAPYMEHFVVSSIHDMTWMLNDAGLSDEEAKMLVEEVIEELKQPERCGVFKAYSITGVKI